MATTKKKRLKSNVKSSCDTVVKLNTVGLYLWEIEAAVRTLPFHTGVKLLRIAGLSRQGALVFARRIRR